MARRGKSVWPDGRCEDPATVLVRRTIDGPGLT